jgi:hypothetical protein
MHSGSNLFYVLMYPDFQTLNTSRPVSGYIFGTVDEGRIWYYFMTEKVKEGKLGEIQSLKKWQITRGRVGFEFKERKLSKFWKIDGETGELYLCEVDGIVFKTFIWDESYFEKNCVTEIHSQLKMSEHEEVESLRTLSDGHVVVKFKVRKDFLQRTATVKLNGGNSAYRCENLKAYCSAKDKEFMSVPQKFSGICSQNLYTIYGQNWTLPHCL